MELKSQILFFLAGLGVFNGILLSIYFFFFTKPIKWVNILFGLLMLMICIRVGKSLFVVFAEIDMIYRQIGLSACMMIGPLLFLYVKNLISSDKVSMRSSWIHLLIPFIGILVVGATWPYSVYPAVWNEYVVHGIYIVWIGYEISAFILVLPLIQRAWKQPISILEQWLVLLVICTILLCLVYNLALYGFPYLGGPILFSTIFYVLTAFLLRSKPISNHPNTT